MPRKKKITTEQWKKAIAESCGIVGMVASILGISRHTVARHRDSDPQIKEMFVEAETMAKDRAEFNIQAALATANLKVSMWFLERKAKDRGYGKEVKVETESLQANVQVLLPDNGRMRP
jgi:hypothetical protein